MTPNELRILEQMEVGFWQEDAAFAQHITGGPRLSGRYRAGLAAVITAGVGLVMLFPMNLLLGVAGYALLVAAGTNMLRRRPLKPADQSPLELFHRLTAGLLRDTGNAVEADVD